jgi:hypothetical protein
MCHPPIPTTDGPPGKREAEAARKVRQQLLSNQAVAAAIMGGKKELATALTGDHDLFRFLLNSGRSAAQAARQFWARSRLMRCNNWPSLDHLVGQLL